MEPSNNLKLMWAFPPGGTGTVTVCVLLVRPEPRHSAQGVFMMDFLPPQRRQVLRIIYVPVLMDSCKAPPTGQRFHEGWRFPAAEGRKTHHASAVTVVAHRHLGAGLAATPVTSRAGVLDVDAQVFIGTHHCL